MYTPNPRNHPPALIETLAVWGWAVAHGGIPLAYAAEIVADHSCYRQRTDIPDPTEFERRTWAAEDLTDWENILVRMAWPGDEAVDEERWDQPGDWRMREYLLNSLGLPDSCESTDRLLLRHCDERIAECERKIAEQSGTTGEEEQ
ncbi:hypothetical protein [Streptomyces capitiformicae]|uniref:Uncharacterized protein n=1 Tax=Streptomyces capitiformicae TaxID=2014920 RepID=A0A919DJK5_9ACTN|nr:hypothetical protein [Streptomyces capitiformicae]GHE51480.1 hypothetical protein GCM10017771_73730 [Streptomyces capitiformicae]